MGKIWGILMIVGLIWIELEVYTEGTRGAFGGIFAELAAADDEDGAHDDRPAPQRAGAALKRAHEKRGERFDRLYDQAN